MLKEHVVTESENVLSRSPMSGHPVPCLHCTALGAKGAWGNKWLDLTLQGRDRKPRPPGFQGCCFPDTGAEISFSKLQGALLSTVFRRSSGTLEDMMGWDEGHGARAGDGAWGQVRHRLVTPAGDHVKWSSSHQVSATVKQGQSIARETFDVD